MFDLYFFTGQGWPVTYYNDEINPFILIDAYTIKNFNKIYNLKGNIWNLYFLPDRDNYIYVTRLKIMNKKRIDALNKI